MRQKVITATKQYIIRINRGEEVITTLTQFCQENRIFSGSLTGLGAADEAEAVGRVKDKETGLELLNL